jgi:hypothetical protein
MLRGSHFAVMRDVVNLLEDHRKYSGAAAAAETSSASDTDQVEDCYRGVVTPPPTPLRSQRTTMCPRAAPARRLQPRCPPRRRHRRGCVVADAPFSCFFSVAIAAVSLPSKGSTNAARRDAHTCTHIICYLSTPCYWRSEAACEGTAVAFVLRQCKSQCRGSSTAKPILSTAQDAPRQESDLQSPCYGEVRGLLARAFSDPVQA